MSQHQDTFLLRVFGLHSVYNQVNETFPYESHLNEDEESILLTDVGRSRPMKRASKRSPAPNLLDSESDTDVSDTESRDVVESNNLTSKKPPSIADSSSVTKPPQEDFHNIGASSTQNAPRPPEQISSHPSRSILPVYNKRFVSKRMVVPPKERALYLWANIINMDEFLTDIYYYFRGKGLLNIVVTRIVDLMILVFVLGFSVFLKWGIDYSQFESRTTAHLTLSDLIVEGFVWKIPLAVRFLLCGFAAYIVLRLVQLYFDYTYKLREIRNFYHHLIGLSSDDELMTISWKTIVERLMLLKDYNSLTSSGWSDLNSKVRLNAHDIANRVMRKENYMIALINKDVLDLDVFGSASARGILLTKTLEWNLKLCINNFVFTSDGQVNSQVLKEHNRNQLAQELQLRFKMAAIINLLLCPFIVVYFVLLYFFRYFNEYKSNPLLLLGLRQYTPYAEWKLREFNELPHFFIRRLHLLLGPANAYINQFPRSFLVLNAMTLANFVLGAFLASLVIMGLWFEDEEHSFWLFEITTGCSALFYISIFGTIWAVTASSNDGQTEGNAPSTLQYVYDPEASLRYVAQFTHYLPSKWNGRLHTVQVKSEFCELYSLRIVVILYEILSLIMTPFILWFKVLRSAGTVIDFFRDFLIHVDGLGYVCYFAMFNFEEKDKNMMHGAGKRERRTGARDNAVNFAEAPRKQRTKVDSDDEDQDDRELVSDYYQDDKMVKSYMYFLESYGGKAAPGRKDVSGGGTTNGGGTTSRGRKESTGVIVGAAAGSDSFSEYDLDYKFDDVEGKPGKKGGVFGMLNQFYKHDNR